MDGILASHIYWRFFVKLHVEFFLKTEHLSVFNLTNPSYLQTSIYQFFLKNLIILYPNIQKNKEKHTHLEQFFM